MKFLLYNIFLIWGRCLRRCSAETLAADRNRRVFRHDYEQLACKQWFPVWNRLSSNQVAWKRGALHHHVRPKYRSKYKQWISTLFVRGIETMWYSRWSHGDHVMVWPMKGQPSARSFRILMEISSPDLFRSLHKSLETAETIHKILVDDLMF
jgi:hypothetical protein